MGNLLELEKRWEPVCVTQENGSKSMITLFHIWNSTIAYKDENPVQER